jgi:hypothetical protein
MRKCKLSSPSLTALSSFDSEDPLRKAMKPLKTENKRPKSSQNFDLFLVCAAKETNQNLSEYL